MDLRKQLIFGALSGGFKLPYSLDFSLGSMGKLVGSTWSIVGGKAVNTPTLNGELLTDPGLEANYTAGQCDTLVLAGTGTPTMVESADAHTGSKAQSYIGNAANNTLRWGLKTATAGAWYQFSVWAKRLAGTSGITKMSYYEAGVMPGSRSYPLTSAAYTKNVLSFLSPAANNMFLYGIGGVSDTVLIDDGSLQVISYPTMFSLMLSPTSDLTVKGVVSFEATDNSLIGLVVRADAQTNPTNCIFVIIRKDDNTPATLGQVSVITKVGSTYTLAMPDTGITFVTDAWLEARASGNTVSIWYDNTQVGTDLTISDAELVGNKFHGIFSTGGNFVDRFFLG